MIAGSDLSLLVDIGSNIGDGFTVGVKAPSSISFIVLEKEITNPTYSDYGFYNFHIPKEHLLEVGTYAFVVTDTTASNETKITKEAMPTPVNTESSVNTCIISGNVRDIAGHYDVDDQVLITAMPLHLPLPGSSSFIAAKKIKTLTDYSGNFSMPILIDTDVIFEIKDAGVRFQATVPDLPSVNLKDLMPSE